MVWQRRTQTAKPPWHYDDKTDYHNSGQKVRPSKDRPPTWEQSNALKKRIDSLSTTASFSPAASTPGLPTKEAEADKARLASLKRMRANATDPEDQGYLDTKIAELTVRLSRRLPLPNRLKLAKEKCDAAVERLERNQAHLLRAQTSLEAAKANHEACMRELKAIKAEVSADCRGGSSPQSPPPAASRALLQASQAPKHLAAMAMQNNGTVHFTAELLADVGTVIDSIPEPHSDTSSWTPLDLGRTPIPEADIVIPDSDDDEFPNNEPSQRQARDFESDEKGWQPVGPRGHAMAPFSRVLRERVKCEPHDPYGTPGPKRGTARSRTRSA